MMDSRPDLNACHVAARCGDLAFFKKNFDKFLLLQPNNAGYLPIHLAKNKDTAELLFSLTQHTEGITKLGILNNAQSSQTMYGKPLEEFLISRGYEIKSAALLSAYPSDEEKFDLAKWWVSHLHIDDYNDVCIQAVEYCNYYFVKSCIEKFENMFSRKLLIGCKYLDSVQALKIQQIIYEYFNVILKISPPILPNTFDSHQIINDPAAKLEGA